MAAKEWRVVSTRVFGTFKCFGEHETAARDFIEVKPRLRRVQVSDKTWVDKEVIVRGDNLMNDDVGPYRLESRSLGVTGDDSTWMNEAFRDDDRDREA